MKNQFAFGRINFILLAIGMAIVVLGYILMSGKGCTETAFNPAVFDAMHVKVAPAITFFGYIFIIVAILYKGKNKEADNTPKDEK